MLEIAPYFRDVVRKPFNADRSAIILLNRMIDEQDHRDVVVPIRRLYATQHSVNEDFAAVKDRYLPNDHHERPAVVRYQGALYITDGHHRITAQAISGHKYIAVRLFDLDDTWDPTPLLDFLEAEISQ